MFCRYFDAKTMLLIHVQKIFDNESIVWTKKLDIATDWNQHLIEIDLLTRKSEYPVFCNIFICTNQKWTDVRVDILKSVYNKRKSFYWFFPTLQVIPRQCDYTFKIPVSRVLLRCLSMLAITLSIEVNAWIRVNMFVCCIS